MSPPPPRASLGHPSPLRHTPVTPRRVARGVALALSLAPWAVTAQELQPSGAPPASPTEPAPRTVPTGVVGRVLDARTGEPLLDTPVAVVGGAWRARTDLDGYFALELPPGTYTLRAYIALHRPVRLERVVVRRGHATQVTLRVEATAAAPEQELVVVGRADTATAATQLQLRRQSASVSDGLSAEEIARSPDATASDAIRRVVGASLVDNQYMNVRGLGGRYVNVLLNGVPLPPTDPDVPGVQLDLFPAALLGSLTLVKTFTPDLPGDFTGGTLLLATRDFPSRFTLTANVSLAGDTLSHTGTGLRYRGGSLDWLGVDDGTRALPAAVPGVRVEAGQNGLSQGEAARIGRSFPNLWSVRREAPFPNLGLGVTVGNTVRVRGRPLGYLLSLTYGNTLRRALDTVGAVRLEGGDPARPTIGLREQLSQESLTNNVLWSLLGTASYRPADNHEVLLVALWSQAASDYAGVRTGYSETVGSDVFVRRLRWVQRSLLFTQLVGDHRALAGGLRLRWQLFGSLAERYEPDTRDLTYLQDSAGLRVTTGTSNVGRLFSDLRQVEGGVGTDLAIPLRGSTLRLGGLLRATERAFEARRFSYRDSGAADPYAPPEEYFGPDRLGTTLDLVEFTLPADGYRASQRLYAPFARLDLPLRANLRVTGGARLESFRQSVASHTPLADPNQRALPGTDRTDTNVLPAASLAWDLRADMSLRLGYGGTVARPMVRELAPFLFQDFLRNRTVQGNPELHTTVVNNLDLRWELFPGATEVLAASVFYKHFRDPIEPVVLDRNGNITFDNVLGAQNFGAELEARVSLGRLARALRSVTVSANLTVVHSQVTLSEAQQRTATNAERPLAGQSPYLTNVTLGYEPRGGRLSAFIYYNVFGPRLEDVGRFGLPDVYQDALHQLDAALVWVPSQRLSLRFTARNLLFQAPTLRQGGIPVQQTQAAMGVAVRASWTY
ncbi:MAG: TonB-dependent receptor [Deltaproteobacteria bacterium]|nr:TonB-dependent receptor [Deltaproteobacteria bacterium]